MMRPVDVACPFCAAQPDDPCASVHPPQFVRDICGWHPERIEAAQFINSLEDRASEPSTNMPVTEAEKTGLF